MHAGVDSKFGNSANPAAGTFSPVNYAATFPVQQEGNYILPTEYYLFQTLGTDKLVAIVGKATGINFADLSIFAGNKDAQFMNVSLNNNLMLGAFIPWVSTWYGGSGVASDAEYPKRFSGPRSQWFSRELRGRLF